MNPGHATLDWISPSAFNRLKSCGLAEVFRRRSAGRNRPSSPQARLGNAAHRTLEWIARSAEDLVDENAEESISQRWILEVRSEYEASLGNIIEQTHGPLESWPGFHRITACIKVDGMALARELSHIPISRRLPEHQLATSSGRLRGTADLIVVDDDGSITIIDHKTGSVSNEDVRVGGKYYQQILLYAAMAGESGFNPTHAEVRPLGKSAIEVELSEDRIDDAIAEAERQLDRYNRAVSSGSEIALGNPSDANCEWCPYNLECPVIWQSEESNSSEAIAFEGMVTAVQVMASSAAIRLSSRGVELSVIGLPLVDINGRSPAIGDSIRVAGVSITSSGKARAKRGRVRMMIL